MRFGVLGPLLVSVDDAEVGIPGGRQRTLLATLLLHARHTVSLADLGEAVWDGRSPGSAATLRTYVMRLRRALGPDASARLVARPDGYLLDAGDDEVDLLRFHRLCRDGGVALRDGEWAEASGIFADALALWRGTPLADVASELLQREHVPRLEQSRLRAIEGRVDADLELGRDAEVVDELREVTARYPMREHGQGQLMLALYRTGRQAEALDVYREVRTRLIEDLGVEPGDDLRRLHRRILNADPSLAADAAPDRPRREPVPETPPDRVPAQLPAEVAAFTGRRRELAELDALLVAPDTAAGVRDLRPAPAVVSAVSGTAGVGKTALVIHWAHRARHRFPDGQLYVNLRGYDPGRPVPAGDALAGFLDALGVPARDIPTGLDERAARYRTETARRRLLIILDNAASVTQVRPLLPGSATCAVLVTSRDSLSGLVAVDGARRLDLDVLTLDEALALLRQLIGARVDEEPEAARVLAVQCARLPLALRVAAELAAGRPAAPLGDLVTELADRQRRLDRLDVGGDPHAAVATVFSWSYHDLPADTARIFRRLGLHPGQSLDVYAAAALAGTTRDPAAAAVHRLAQAHLIQPVGADRYGQHDLLRAYAAGLATAEDATEGTRAALDRLFDYYLGTAAVAVRVLHPTDRNHRPDVAAPSTPVPGLTDPASARPWLEAELPNLVAVAAHAAEHGWFRHAVDLAAVLYPYLMGARYDDTVAIYTHAVLAARRIDDRNGEARALLGLGNTHSRVGRAELAADCLRRSLDLFRATGDALGQARALSGLGVDEAQVGAYGPAFDHIEEALVQFRVAGDGPGQARSLANLAVFTHRLGHREAAIDYLEQALTLFRADGDRLREARTLTSLAIFGQELGRYEQSVDHVRYSLSLHRAVGDREGEAWTVNVLGDIEQDLARYDEAAEHHRESLALARQLGNRNREAEALHSLGKLYNRSGRPETAAEHLRRAVALFRDAGGNQFGQADALNDLGQAVQALKRPSEAVTEYTAALRIAAKLSFGELQVRAHLGLGHAHRALGDRATARRHYREAVALSTAAGTTVPDEVRAYIVTAHAPR